MKPFSRISFVPFLTFTTCLLMIFSNGFTYWYWGTLLSSISGLCSCSSSSSPSPPSSSEPAFPFLESAAYEFPWIPNNPDPDEIGLSKRLDPSAGFDNPLNSPELVPVLPNNPELNNPPELIFGFASSFFDPDKKENPDPLEDEDKFAKRPVPAPAPAPKRLVELFDPNKLEVVLGKLPNNPLGFSAAASLVSEVFLFS